MTNISPIVQIRELYKRLERAEILVSEGKVHPVAGEVENHYIVQGSRGYYLVNGTCSCPDAQRRPDFHHGWCKHRLAVELYKEVQQQGFDHRPLTTNGYHTCPIHHTTQLGGCDQCDGAPCDECGAEESGEACYAGRCTSSYQPSPEQVERDIKELY